MLGTFLSVSVAPDFWRWQKSNVVIARYISMSFVQVSSSVSSVEGPSCRRQGRRSNYSLHAEETIRHSIDVAVNCCSHNCIC